MQIMRRCQVQSAAVISPAALFAHPDNAARIAQSALAERIATICEWEHMARQGCMIGYGPDFAELRAKVADYIDRIARGGSPAEMPVESPTAFRLAINLKTARALGVTLPGTLLTRADELFE